MPKPKTETSFYVVEDLPAGLVASFCVSDDGNVIYFGDCRSNFYCYDVENRKFLWKNMNSSVAGMFSNRSPALCEDKVIFPAGTKPGQTGAVIALDRNTGQEVWCCRFNSSSPQYAPSIIKSPDAEFVLVPTVTTWGEGAIVELDGSTGQLMHRMPVCSEETTDRYAMGCTGGLSFAGFWGVSSDAWGTVGWFVVPELDFKAVKIDPGVPAGEKAKSGQTYTATVEFGSLYNTWTSGLSEVGIDADVNGQSVVLTDADGKELPKYTYNGKTFYVLSPVPSGENTWTVKFNWTAPAADKAVLRAWINLQMGRIPIAWSESDGASPSDPKNNLVQTEVPVEIQGVDIAVTAEPAKEVFVLPYGGGPAVCPVNIEVFRKGGEFPETVAVKLTAEAEGLGDEAETFDLYPGDSYGTVFMFKASKAGKYKVTVQAWPIGVTDTDTSNNICVCYLNVKEPSPVEKDTNLRHELSGR